MITVNTEFNPTNELDNVVDYCKLNYSNLNDLIVVLIPINEYNSLIINNTVLSFYDKAKEFDADVIILFDFHSWPIIPSNLDQTPIKTIALHYDFNLYNNPKNNSFYYPNWLFFVQHKPIQHKLTTIYPISCGGRNFNNGRAGKIYNYQKLKQQRYFDQILFTRWSNGDLEYFSVPSEFEDPEFFNEFQQFALEYNTWPSCNDTDLSLVNSMGVFDINIYTKSLFHLVAESRINESLLSEKTFKALYAQQIPILCAAPGAVAHLRELGFDMFDDIVDHDHYDTIIEWKQRIVAMHESIDSIIDLDHNQLLQDTQQRRQRNFDYINSFVINQLIYDPIVNAILK